MPENGELPAGLGIPIVVALLLANAIFVAAEFSLVTVRRTRIDRLVDEGDTAARRVKDALGNLDYYIAAAQLGITMASILLGFVGEPVLAAMIEPPVEAIVGSFAPAVSHTLAIAVAFILVTSLHIIIGEFIPKSIALERAEWTALGISLPLAVFVRIFGPVIWLLNATGNRLLHLLRMDLQPLGDDVLTAEDLAHTFESSASAGLISRRELSLTRHLLHLSEIECRELMVPRSQVVALERSAGWEHVVAVFGEHPLARFPIYDGSIDNIVGIVDARRLLLARDQERRDRWQDDIVDATVLPESVSAEDALQVMRRHARRMVLLVDEYGGTAGIITQFDIVKYLATDLPAEMVQSERHVDGARDSLPQDLNGLVPVAELREISGVELPESAASTIGGLVTEALNRIPSAGDCARIAGLRFTVLEMDRYRVAKVRVERDAARSGTEEEIE